MATDLPYMPSVGNVPAILQKIRGAGTPPKFTAEFVKSSLGFTASQDRTFPRILKQLRFISQDSVPLARYNDFKSASSGGRALAQGLRDGWAPIFLADQSAQKRSAGELADIFKTVTGQSESVAKKMASIFKILADQADWTAAELNSASADSTDASSEESTEASDSRFSALGATADRQAFNLHHDIHLHIPPTSDVSVYRAIFRALREELQ